MKLSCNKQPHDRQTQMQQPSMRKITEKLQLELKKEHQ